MDEEDANEVDCEDCWQNGPSFCSVWSYFVEVYLDESVYAHLELKGLKMCFINVLKSEKELVGKEDKSKQSMMF